MRPSASRRSRVTPGVSSTSAILRPTSRLNSVDLPTLGRPTMATSDAHGASSGLAGGGRQSHAGGAGGGVIVTAGVVPAGAGCRCRATPRGPPAWAGSTAGVSGAPPGGSCGRPALRPQARSSWPARSPQAAPRPWWSPRRRAPRLVVDPVMLQPPAWRPPLFGRLGALGRELRNVDAHPLPHIAAGRLSVAIWLNVASAASRSPALYWVSPIASRAALCIGLSGVTSVPTRCCTAATSPLSTRRLAARISASSRRCVGFRGREGVVGSDRVGVVALVREQRRFAEPGERRIAARAAGNHLIQRPCGAGQVVLRAASSAA